MKRLLLILAALMGFDAGAQNVPDWENPDILGVNKLPYHATLQLPSKMKECQEIVSLDGKWLFHWSKNPDERPADFKQRLFHRRHQRRNSRLQHWLSNREESKGGFQYQQS